MLQMRRADTVVNRQTISVLPGEKFRCQLNICGSAGNAALNVVTPAPWQQELRRQHPRVVGINPGPVGTDPSSDACSKPGRRNQFDSRSSLSLNNKTNTTPPPPPPPTPPPGRSFFFVSLSPREDRTVSFFFPLGFMSSAVTWTRSVPTDRYLDPDHADVVGETLGLPRPA